MNNFDTTRRYRAIEVSYDKSQYRPYYEDDWKEFKGKGWIRSLTVLGKRKIIGVCFQDGNYVGGVIFEDGFVLDFRELFYNYKHLDGSPCGVKIQN